MLKEARARGWYLRRNSDHSWGTLVCRVEVSAKDACDYDLFSSGTGAEGAAKAHLVKIRRGCNHRPKPVDLEGAAKMIEVASCLMDAASQILEGFGDKREAEAVLDAAELTMDEVGILEQALQRASELEDSGRRSILEGVAGAVRAGVDPGDPPEASFVLDEAEVRLNDAKAVVAGLAGAEPRVLRARLSAQRTRLKDLRERAGGQ